MRSVTISQVLSLLIVTTVLFAGNAAAIAAPQINTLSDATLTRSGRLLIFGANFGSAHGSGQVLIGGLPAIVTTWTNTEIHAYVPVHVPMGLTTLVVASSDGTKSNPVTIRVVPPSPCANRIRWRFQVDSAFILHRPAIGPDGSIYVNDIGGFLYALDSTGALQWVFDTQGNGAEGPVAVGFDGTIYVVGNPLGPENRVYALNPDGTIKWVFTDNTQEIIAGPSLGPDGNVYAVTDSDGIGAFSLTPGGALRWCFSGFSDFGQSGTEIAFGSPSQFYFSLRGFFNAFTLNGNRRWQMTIGSQSKQVATGPDGSVYVETFLTGEGVRLRAFDINGNEQWVFFGSGTNVITAPDVGPDGVIYVVRNGFQLHSINPDGSSRWLQSDPNFFGPVTTSGSPYSGPIVSPGNSKLLIGGVTTLGGPGLIEAFDTATGAPLWCVLLPLENGGRVVPASRPIFTPDGQTAYVGTSIPGQDPNNEIAFLYAINTADVPVVPGDINGDGVVNMVDAKVFIAVLVGTDTDPNRVAAADLNGDGGADGLDIQPFVGVFIP